MRNLWTNLAAVVVYSLFIVTSVFGQSVEEVVMRNSSDGWQETVDLIRRIRFEMPAKAQFSQKDRITQYILSKDGGETEFMVAIHQSDDPDFAIGALAMLQTLRDTLVNAFNGTILDEEEISLDGHLGRELMLKSPDGFVLKQRTYVRGQQLIQLIVVLGPKSTAAPSDVVRFFKSVRLRRQQ